MEMTERKNSAPVREISVITAEIKDLCRQAQTMALLYAVEIGRRLEEAKQALPYGKWGDWLKNEVEFSQSTANNFMRLFEEYGTSQISIFGASVDSQTFANLPYSKALQLLAIPKDEREAFAEKVGAEDLSVKELKAAIEERDSAIRAEAEAKAREEALADRLAEAERAAEESTDREKEAEELRRKVEEMNAELEKAKKKSFDLREKLKNAEANPKLPPEALEKLRREAGDAAKAEAEKALLDKLEKAAERLKSAEAEAIAARLTEKVAREQLEEAQKKLKTANPAVTEFKVVFETVQEGIAKLKKMVDKIKESDHETADKLSAAIKALAEGMKK